LLHRPNIAIWRNFLYRKITTAAFSVFSVGFLQWARVTIRLLRFGTFQRMHLHNQCIRVPGFFETAVAFAVDFFGFNLQLAGYFIHLIELYCHPAPV